MTDTKQPEALRWATLLRREAQQHGATDYKHKAADVLERLHAENVTLQQDYDAAWLEIESLNERIAVLVRQRDAAQAAPAAVTGPALDFADAYQGAREDLAIWKRRALAAERDLRAEQETSSRLAAEINALNGPTRMGEPAAVAVPVATYGRLHNFARAIEAEVHKQDTELIQQMLHELENINQVMPFPVAAQAIAAARARLGEQT